MTDWAKFQSFGTDPENPFVTILTITNRGLIILPTKMMTAIFPKAKFAQVLFSHDDTILAIRFHVEKKAGIGIFTLTQTSRNVRIAAKSALQYFSIDFIRTRSYLARIDVEESAIFIDIHNVLSEK